MSQGLLEKLGRQMKAPFLSDLRMMSCREELVRQLSAVRAEDYPLAEWRDAAQYLLGKTKGAFRDSEDAKDFLIKEMQK